MTPEVALVDRWDATAARSLPKITLHSDRVALRPPESQDYARLRQLELSEELAFRWRFHGATPGPEEYAQSLWRGTLCQYLVMDVARSRAVGVLSAYNADSRNGFCYVAGAKFDPKERTTLFLEGALLFLNMLFSGFNFRKLYLDTPEYNLAQLRSGIGRLFNIEGRLVDHWVVGDGHFDQVMMSVTRERWNELSPPLLKFVRAAKASQE
jgi:RimJ/RimL family protein N-acetyltransferase